MKKKKDRESKWIGASVYRQFIVSERSSKGLIIEKYQGVNSTSHSSENLC